MKKKSKCRLDRLGIAILDGKMMYAGHGVKEAFMFSWPMWIKRLIVHVYNAGACMQLGHGYLCRRRPGELPICCDCSSRVDPGERSVTNEY